MGIPEYFFQAGELLKLIQLDGPAKFRQKEARLKSSLLCGLHSGEDSPWPHAGATNVFNAEAVGLRYKHPLGWDCPHMHCRSDMNAVPGMSRVHHTCRSCVQGTTCVWDVSDRLSRWLARAINRRLPSQACHAFAVHTQSICLSRTYQRQCTELICVKLGFVVQDLQMSGSPVCGPRR